VHHLAVHLGTDEGQAGLVRKLHRHLVVVEEEREHGVDGESVISLYKMF
jgi:hypothetical protein